MQIMTDVKPTKELEAAVAAELGEAKNETSMASLIAPYGYCPTCGSKGVETERRPNGITTCEKGHKHNREKFTS